MDLAFKCDFQQTQGRWNRFWRDPTPEPMVSAIVPKPGKTPVPKPPYASGRNGDFTPVIDQLLRWAETHEFLGDAIPYYYLEFGANQFASFLGTEMRFPEGIEGYGWAEPCLTTLIDVDIAFRPDSPGWQMVADFAEALRERTSGALLIASPTLVGNLDALAAIRGTQELLIDLIEHPAAVHAALERIDDAHQDALDALGELLDYGTWGSINRHGLYASGPMNVAQCDFSCMIGPAMFREFAVPAIERELQRYDGGEYHLDGPDALRHLEALCSIDALDLIQWVPGAGNERRDWSGLFANIHRLGKGQLRGGDSGQVRSLRQSFGGTKLVLNLAAAERDQALRSIEQFRLVPHPTAPTEAR